MRRGVVVLDALEEAAVVVLHEAPVHHDLELARGQRGAAQRLPGYHRHAAGEEENTYVEVVLSRRRSSRRRAVLVARGSDSCVY